jgi:dihydroflavonol-4-reductase
MTRALVTGSTGGVGSNLAEALIERGIEVVGLRRSTSPEDAVEGLKMQFVTGDILKPETLRPALEGIDWVFHVAAIADDWKYPAETIHKVNVGGARNVMQAALDTGVKRFVLTSSAAALGKPEFEKQLMDETKEYNFKPDVWPYGYSKYLANQAMREFAAKGLSAAAVMPSAIMGPRDLKFIGGEVLVRVLKKQAFPFPRGGLNWIDTRDVVAGHIAAAEKGRPGETYVLGGENMTHTEYMEIVGDILKVKPRILRIPRFILPPFAATVTLLHSLGMTLPVERARVLMSGTYIWYDTTKAVTELGLTTRPFNETVREAYEWYRDNGYFEKRGIAASPLAA